MFVKLTTPEIMFVLAALRIAVDDGSLADHPRRERLYERVRQKLYAAIGQEVK
jgi:hypothetical protein